MNFQVSEYTGGWLRWDIIPARPENPHIEFKSKGGEDVSVRLIGNLVSASKTEKGREMVRAAAEDVLSSVRQNAEVRSVSMRKGCGCGRN